eukprot:756605-Hanusia_phi.AAC.8
MELLIEEDTTAEQTINMIRESAQLNKKLRYSFLLSPRPFVTSLDYRLRIASQDRFMPPMA